MKNLKSIAFIIIIFWQIMPAYGQTENYAFTGAWKSENGVIIISGSYFSYALFNAESKAFEGTYGGKWSYENGMMIQVLEFNTFDQVSVGQKMSKKTSIDKNKLNITEEEFVRLDDGKPGELEGAWLFSGRKRDGEIQTRDTNQPRKTMKILSGTRFQWIAYNVETGAFSGTGGGTYSTENSKYVEQIDFFSRDNSRVGATLSFDYDLIDGVWNHSGLNSRGEPMYEFWSRR